MSARRSKRTARPYPSLVPAKELTAALSLLDELGAEFDQDAYIECLAQTGGLLREYAMRAEIKALTALRSSD